MAKTSALLSKRATNIKKTKIHKRGRKMMRRIYAGIVCLALMLALFASCTIRPTDPEEASPTPEQTAVQSNDVTEPEEPVDPTETAEPSVEPTATPSIDEPAGQGAPVRGTWSDDVYYSEFSGLSFVLPEGWVAASDEELAALLGIAEETMTDEEAWILEVARMTSVYDMMAMNPLTGDNVIIMYENIALTMGGLQISEADYLELLKNQLQTMQDTSYQFDDMYETDFSGITYTVLPAYEENLMLSQYYAVCMQGDYIVAVIITAQFGDVDAIMDYFI
jgi:hypothetical protein